MTPTRKRRLIVVGLVFAAVAVATTLIVVTLGQNTNYLFSPSEIAAGHVPAGATFRLGGVVLEHSVRRAADSLRVDFVVTDRFKDMPVQYTGILPDLFREGQSIVATGSMQGDRFVATTAESAALQRGLPDALAVEMEGAAFAQVCHDFGVPLAVVRTISDRADDAAHVDFPRFLREVASRYSGALIDTLLRT